MGLDQRAYRAAKENSTQDESNAIEFWRAHTNLHLWMRDLWLRKIPVDHVINIKRPSGRYSVTSFNGAEVELTWEDLDQLENDIKNDRLQGSDFPGLLYGPGQDAFYKPKDLEFIKKARVELFLGSRVFYNSSW